MSDQLRTVFLSCLTHMMRPIARFCLRRSLSIQELVEAAKAAMVQEAEEELNTLKATVNPTKLSVATGIHRTEVKRIWHGESKRLKPTYEISIIGQWLSDEDFLTKSGKPRILSCEGEESEFAHLVAKVAPELTYGMLIFELEKAHLVERTPRGLKLIESAFIGGEESVEKGLQLYAQDAYFMLEAVEENLFHRKPTPSLHIRTDFDNIRQSALPEIRKWFYHEGKRFHEKARKFVAKFDLDITPLKKGENDEGGGQVALGSFSKVYDE